ncbi:MAG TPA: NAD(P)-dependent oxidoreductase [Acidimicrobiia bacterium]|nr:NAD(P)-dependent oxidoreductase [Acidimicrobiia bacterium]
MTAGLETTVGWIGAGRMGEALCRRLLAAGVDLSVYNRTREKVAGLEDLGAHIVDSPAKLADRDLVFTMVADPAAFLKVTTGRDGLFSVSGAAPRVLIDASTVSADASERVRAAALERGCALLAAPVSGNPKVVTSGRLTVVASGPREAFEQAQPFLELFGQGVSYVGEGDAARLVKICHNLMLGIVSQTLAETATMAERAGVSRADYMEFINMSVMGSTFTRYKTPAIVKLDFTPTFTGHLLRKDFELGLEAGRQYGVPLPTAALVHQIIMALIGRGYGEDDFIRLLTMQAESCGLELTPEDAPVTDGLG